MFFGLKSNGAVVAGGSNDYGECDVQDWTDIISVVIRDSTAVGLKSCGTVVVAGEKCENYDVSKWTDIVSIAFDDGIIAELKADGTVVATGDNEYKACEVTHWKNIVAVTVLEGYTIGIGATGKISVAGDLVGLRRSKHNAQQRKFGRPVDDSEPYYGDWVFCS